MRVLKVPMQIVNGQMVMTSSANEAWSEKIKTILNTQKLERIGNPNFGVSLADMVFDSQDDTTYQTMKNMIANAFSQYLPELKLQSVDIVNGLQNGLTEVTIQYSTPGASIEQTSVLIGSSTINGFVPASR